MGWGHLEERIEALKQLKITCAMCGKEAPSVFTHWYTISQPGPGIRTLTICPECFHTKISPHLKESLGEKPMIKSGESRRDKLREELGEVIRQFARMAKGEGNIYESCPIINTKLPEEICRAPKLIMKCPTDAFCCKDCPEFPNCDAQCQVAVELTKLSKEGKDEESS